MRDCHFFGENRTSRGALKTDGRGKFSDKAESPGEKRGKVLTICLVHGGGEISIIPAVINATVTLCYVPCVGRIVFGCSFVRFLRVDAEKYLPGEKSAGNFSVWKVAISCKQRVCRNIMCLQSARVRMLADELSVKKTEIYC